MGEAIVTTIAYARHAVFCFARHHVFSPFAHTAIRQDVTQDANRRCHYVRYAVSEGVKSSVVQAVVEQDAFIVTSQVATRERETAQAQ